MIATGWEVWWYRRQVLERTDLENQVHAYHDVEQEVTMEQPETCGRVRTDSIVLNSHWRQAKPPSHTYRDYQRGNALPRSHCLAPRWYPSVAAGCTVGATNHGDQGRARASD